MEKGDEMNAFTTLIINDIKNNKRYFIRNLIFATLIFIFIATIICYSFAVKDALNTADSVNLSSNRIVAMLNKENFNNEALKEKAKDIKSAYDVRFFADKMNLGVETIFLENENELGKVSALDINYIDGLYDAYVKEFDAKYGKSLFISGRDASAKDEMVISYDLLTQLGFNNANEAIGKIVTLKSKKQFAITSQPEEVTIVENMTIVGVLDKEFFTLDVYQNASMPTIIMSTQNVDLNDNHTLLFMHVYLDSYFNIDEAIAELESIIPSDVFIAQTVASPVMASLEGQRKLVLAILAVFVVLFSIMIFANMIYECLESYKKNEYHYSVLLTSGLTKFKLFAICFVEQFIVNLVATSIAVIASLLIILIINAVIKSMFTITLTFNAVAFGCVVGVIIGVAILISLVFSVLPLIVLRKNMVKNE